MTMFTNLKRKMAQAKADADRLLRGLKVQRAGVAVAAVAAASPAFASTTTTSAQSAVFDNFANTVLSWAQGSLGTGLAVTMMLMGAGMGVARNSPMPALSGIAGAAFLNWGPGIIQSLTTGALI
jgi:conjugal transfer pilus assembly protein TraA